MPLLSTRSLSDAGFEFHLTNRVCLLWLLWQEINKCTKKKSCVWPPFFTTAFTPRRKAFHFVRGLIHCLLHIEYAFILTYFLGGFCFCKCLEKNLLIYGLISDFFFLLTVSLRSHSMHIFFHRIPLELSIFTFYSIY